MDIQAKILGEAWGPRFVRRGVEARDALRESAKDAAEEIERRGRLDISRAGNFGARWTEGFHADVTEGGGHIRINVKEDVPYWTVFEYGAVIQGRPLLWIPLDMDHGGSADAQGVSARDYPQPLFRVDRQSDGLPLLLSWEPGVKDSAKVVYFGKEEVVEPKKFHIREIVREVAKKIQQYFQSHYRRG
jgi:hypothetical protein